VSDANIKVIQSAYEAFGRGDVEAILDLCTDDVDWATLSELRVAPWHGAFHGKAEVPTFFEQLAKTVDFTGFTPLSFTSNETDVMVAIESSLTVRETGKSATNELHHWWKLRDGKICFYRGSEDTAHIQQVLS
jgi:ketosteroid isomerase-like protein